MEAIISSNGILLRKSINKSYSFVVFKKMYIKKLDGIFPHTAFQCFFAILSVITSRSLRMFVLSLNSFNLTALSSRGWSRGYLFLMMLKMVKNLLRATRKS